ncbi:RNA dependent RNA polymerase-domain-containing protein [Mycena maculata]|uniref:RNA-dependent RNA polymerase n=1 Tax=Mycena maculata TaxID=230809 RepID=A0AAD7HK96_9AGAR|nr:RNA dependent RNA polymerase-domain-containing protein [Mycena maculata]
MGRTEVFNDDEEDSDAERWSSFDFDSSQTLVPSSPVSKSSPEPPKVATHSLKRKLETESFGDPPVKKLKYEVAKFRLVTTTARHVQGTEPFVIAGFQDPSGQDAFHAISGISRGVIWEMARLVSLGRLDGVCLDDLKKLTGANTDAVPKTIETLLKEKAREISIDAAFDAERKSQCPWAELDLEEAALSANPNAGLGNCPEYLQGYGGKVSFTGTIDAQIPDKSRRLESVKVVLDRSTLASSCRLARRFGSSSFLRLKVPSKILHSNAEGLKDFFQKPFVIFDRVFRSFYAKDGAVFLFRTRERCVNGVVQTVASAHGLTLFEFLNEFNPLDLNANQLVCKWASRFALGLSNSVPGPVLSPADVKEIDDISSPAQSNMTDGCGISNQAFSLKLRRDFKLESTPCAVQIRHGGRKGMLLMSPELSDDPTPRVEFRKPSQIKIVYSKEAKAHPANSTIDILRFSRTRTPARISPEVIINLEHNGVPAEVFEGMQDVYLAEGVDELLFWAREGPEGGRDKPEHMFQLWSAVEKSEGVYFARRVREAGGEARVRGFGDRFTDTAQEDDEEEPETFDKAIHERSTAWWPDYISGSPSSLAETAMCLLDAGFTPQALPVLREKLKQVVKTKIKYRAQHFKYEVAESASAFVVPDFWDALEEDQIHFKSSRREFRVKGGIETDIVVGDILMTRNPCKVPTDVRKLKAVKHPALHDLVDVIVCSVKGNRRLLDFLAGGDYDGDTAIVIWDTKIVDAFSNADEKHSIEPAGINSCFTRDETTVAEFIAVNAGKSPEAKAAELQKYLLASLRDASVVGQYSSYHDNAIVTKGYANPRTVKLAYQFCKILDSAKTGYAIRLQTRNADQRTYHHARGPAWKNREKEAKAGLADRTNVVFLQRKVDPGNPMLSRPFIMDVLNRAALRQENNWLADAEQLFLPFENSPQVLDLDLTKPWNDFKDFAKKVMAKNPEPHKDLSTIERHVQHMYERHSQEIKGITPKDKDRKNAFTERRIEIRQDTLRALSRDFAAFPSPQDLQTVFDPALIARLRASYAYLYDHEKYKGHGRKGWSRFPWDMALGELCRIKTTALGSHKAVTTRFYERFKMGGDKRH